MKGIRFVLAIFLLGILAVFLGPCSSGKLSSILVEPSHSSIPVGLSQQFSAFGSYTDQGPTPNISTQVTWSSSNPAVATIDNTGLATAISAGTVTITASSGEIAGSATLMVTTATLSSITVTPAAPIPAVGLTEQFTATGTYSDGTSFDITTQATWNSSNPSVATVSSRGLATAVSGGTVTITATLGTVSASTILMVNSGTLISIVVMPVTPSMPSMPEGVTQQFTATGTYSDGTSRDITTQVTWNSSNTSVATVNSIGLATALAAGAPTITATSGTVSGSTILTVSSATLSSIAVAPVNSSIPVGLSQQFTATGIYSDGTSHDITSQVIWQTSNILVARLNSPGLVASIAAGTVTITATSGSIIGSTTVTVTPATLSSIAVAPVNSSIPVGLSQQFTATGTYSDGTSFDITTQATWNSSNPSVATVSRRGLATAVSGGTATIMATLGTVSASTILTVSSATLSSIAVASVNPSIPVGFSQQFTATGIFSDGTSYDITRQVTWSSSNISVGTVNSTGLAAAVGAGTGAITATAGTVSGSTILTVTSG